MNITLFGAVVLVISIYAFFRNKELLLYIMVFLSTFTAAAVINIDIIEVPILTFEFTGALWLLRELIDFIKQKPKITKDIIIEKFKNNKIALAFLIFIVTAILGEIALIILGDRVNYVTDEGITQTIQFSFSNIKQLLIIVFVFVIMIVLSFKIKTKDEVKKLLKVFCISTIFAVIWGLLQFVTYYFGIDYPAFLFNNNSFVLQCYGQIDNNVKRICSIALEPSTFAINLTCFMPFILGAFLTINDKFKEKKNIIIFVVLILTTICAILTTSSTSYLGLVVVYGLYGIYILFGFKKDGIFDNRKRNFIKLLIVTVVSCAIAAVLCVVSIKIGYKLGNIDYIETEVEETDTTTKKEEEDEENKEKKYNSAFENMLSTLKQMTVDKLVSYSGQERLSGEETGFSMFKYSPIFGIGYGSYRTFSLFSNILISSGVVGIISFFYILYVVLKPLWKYRQKNEKISIMFIISIIGTTIALFIGVPDFVLTYYWIILTLAYKYVTIEE